QREGDDWDEAGLNGGAQQGEGGAEQRPQQQSGGDGHEEGDPSGHTASPARTSEPLNRSPRRYITVNATRPTTTCGAPTCDVKRSSPGTRPMAGTMPSARPTTTAPTSA